MKIPGGVGRVACPAHGFSHHRRPFQSVHLIVFTGENLAPKQDSKVDPENSLIFFASFQKPGFVAVFHIADSQFVSSRQSQPSADDAQDDDGGVTVCAALFYTLGCLGPGLVTATNEVTDGKWIPDFFFSLSFYNSLWLFTHRRPS